MLERKYIKKIVPDNLVIPDQEAILRDNDCEFSNQFRNWKDMWPEGEYIMILKTKNNKK